MLVHRSKIRLNTGMLKQNVIVEIKDMIFICIYIHIFVLNLKTLFHFLSVYFKRYYCHSSTQFCHKGLVKSCDRNFVKKCEVLNKIWVEK